MIEPLENPYACFRNEAVMFGEFVGADHGKIYNLLDDLIYNITNSDLHKVLLAANTHIRFVQIHPYMDGNGRAARLLQNHILVSNGYTPAIIPDTERGTYINLMRLTIRDRFSHKSNSENPSESELMLQQYFADKVLTTTSSLRDRLKKSRRHKIRLYCNNSGGGAKATAAWLRAIGKKLGHPLKVQAQKGKKPIITITGDIGREELKKLLNRNNTKMFSRFEMID